MISNIALTFRNATVFLVRSLFMQMNGRMAGLKNRKPAYLAPVTPIMSLFTESAGPGI